MKDSTEVIEIRKEIVDLLEEFDFLREISYDLKEEIQDIENTVYNKQMKMMKIQKRERGINGINSK